MLDKTYGDINGIDCRVVAMPQSEATITHLGASRKVKIAGLTALVGTVIDADGNNVKLFIKWVSHPFYQYGSTR